MGFESSRDLTSTRSDRTVHMSDDGQIVYGGWPAPGQRTVVSAQSSNDGQWHHLAVVATGRGSLQSTTRYLNGQQVDAGNTSRTDNYTGWCPIGHGATPTGTTPPSTSGFHGLIDNVAIYPTPPPAERIKARYNAR